MPLVGFEPTIPVFQRAKTVHALDRAATVIGLWELITNYSMQSFNCFDVLPLKSLVNVRFYDSMIVRNMNTS
jgi:hypothetical protein